MARDNSGYFFRTPGSGSSGGSSVLSVVAKTTTYLATISDDVILVSGSVFTVTLYAASGNTGRVLRIKKTDSSLTNIITIDGNASETIDGATTVTLNTQYEEYTIVCDGSNWHVLDHAIPSQRAAYTPIFVGLGTVASIDIQSWRLGQCLYLLGNFTTGTATGVTATMTLGFAGTSANVTIATNPTAIAQVGMGSAGGIVNPSAKLVTVLGTGGGTVLNFSLNRVDSATNPLVAQLGNVAFFDSTKYSINACVPISGWTG